MFLEERGALAGVRVGLHAAELRIRLGQLNGLDAKLRE